MRIALLSDIHANHLALAAVLEAVRSDRIDRLLVAGDLVGYYYEPGRVLEMLHSWMKHMVRGNHEDMLAAARNDDEVLAGIERRYGSGLRVALESLSGPQVDDLIGMPESLALEFDGYRVLLCHGSPWDTDHYVYPDADEELLARCAVAGFDAVVMGHTHYPMVRTVNGVMLVNPGSVGQPRDRRPGAAWAVLDTIAGGVELRHETYDASALMADARMRDPALPYLCEVLERH